MKKEQWMKRDINKNGREEKRANGGEKKLHKLI